MEDHGADEHKEFELTIEPPFDSDEVVYYHEKPIPDKQDNTVNACLKLCLNNIYVDCWNILKLLRENAGPTYTYSAFLRHPSCYYSGNITSIDRIKKINPDFCVHFKKKSFLHKTEKEYAKMCAFSFIIEQIENNDKETSKIITIMVIIMLPKKTNKLKIELFIVGTTDPKILYILNTQYSLVFYNSVMVNLNELYEHKMTLKQRSKIAKSLKIWIIEPDLDASINNEDLYKCPFIRGTRHEISTDPTNNWYHIEFEIIIAGTSMSQFKIQ